MKVTLAPTILLLLCSGCRTTPSGQAAEPVDPFVRISEGHMRLAGKRFRFTGVNSYSLLSAAPDAEGFSCGARHTDEEIEKILWDVRQMGGTVIRLSAYRSFTASGTGFGRLDLLIAKANRLGIKLILTLENQWADCTDGGYKTAEWYRDGYRHSYRPYVALIADRYKDEPAIMVWQLMNEAEAKTAKGSPDPDALLLFATDMGALIKQHDRNHLVSLGTIGGDQPGVAGDAFQKLAEVPWIDVIEVHDYGAESDSLPRATRGCLRAALLTAKPCFIGEIGISARQRLGRQKRAEFIARKLDAAWVSGVDGVLIWSFRAGDGVHMDLAFDDPLISKFKVFSGD